MNITTHYVLDHVRRVIACVYIAKHYMLMKTGGRVRSKTKNSLQRVQLFQEQAKKGRITSTPLISTVHAMGLSLNMVFGLDVSRDCYWKMMSFRCHRKTTVVLAIVVNHPLVARNTVFASNFFASSKLPPSPSQVDHLFVVSRDSHTHILNDIASIVVALEPMYGELWLSWLLKVSNHEIKI